MFGPARPLPVNDEFATPDEYITSLLSFITSSALFQHLCGGIHILDFFTRDPDLYNDLLPAEWVRWMDRVDIHDFLDFLLRTDLHDLRQTEDGPSCWKNYPLPPDSLVEFVANVRRHMFVKDFQPLQPKVAESQHGFKPTRKHGLLVSAIPAHVSAGMTEKKVHEVDNFARFINDLAERLERAGTGSSDRIKLVDFGSGQNYLGRVLACEPYKRDIIGIETRSRNIEGAKALDVHARLRDKPKTIVNKKLMKLAKYGPREGKRYQIKEHRPPTDFDPDSQSGNSHVPATQHIPQSSTHGSIQYINHWVVGGDLGPVLSASQSQSDQCSPNTPTLPPVLTISLHSCGNLVHHGLRTLTANPSVKGVALVGCCYNLMTERLTAEPSYKHPGLALLRPDENGTDPCQCRTGDPDGFPMSERFAQYRPSVPHSSPGINLNITSRMMAVQAPYNWGRADSEAFFTRHFFRAVLQRIFVDLDVAEQPNATTSPFRPSTYMEEIKQPERCDESPPNGGSPPSRGYVPIIIGSLPKSAYGSFVAYVRAAGEKIARLGSSPPNTTPGMDISVDGTPIPPGAGPTGPTAVGLPSTLASGADREQHTRVAIALKSLTDEQIVAYEQKYLPRRQQLACLWSLMAFSATVIEAVIVTDRWAWLREVQMEDGSGLREAWVQTVFEGAVSPRNFCVVGIR